MLKERFNELFRHQKWGPSQNYFELKSLIGFMEKHFENDIQRGIEIGTFHGGTLRFFREIMNETGRLISVDLNDRGFIPEVMTECRGDGRLKFVIGDSMAEKTLNEVEEHLEGNFADFVFIDGNHTAEYIKGDHENYSNLVRKGGLIILHDIVGDVINPYWNKVKKDTQSIEIFGKINPFGIGIIINE